MSYSKQPSLHVLIIGGGIAGLTLAAFFQKASLHPRSVRQLTCTVYEAYTRSEAVPGPPGGFGFAPNGIAALASLGLADAVVELSGVNENMMFLTENGNEIGRWRIDRYEYEYPLVCILRHDLQSLLRKELDGTRSTIEYSKTLVSVKQATGKVLAYFADGSSAEGDILIGADGVFLCP
jgi:2-polyprenyl-6-methoxyphenol hydroxylase-like FAD-dependent oxidoreductase